ncbi:hypothetical protein [Anaerotignum neopropionicum]|nr:hypothetical protein [Anaerotignum neopropionicum]
MSAFLGPIHYWLYRKIQLQESLTEAILYSVLSEEKCTALQNSLEAKWGIVERGPLEQVIDNGNIHGWLQSQIGIAEKRFAAAVTEILHNHPTQIEKLKQAAYQLGQQNLLPDSNDAMGIYQALNNVLLEGMPCDHVNEILEQSDQHVLWQQTVDLHLSFWEEVGGRIENYYLLRGAFILGSLSGSRFSFQQKNKQFLIQEV